MEEQDRFGWSWLRAAAFEGNGEHTHNRYFVSAVLELPSPVLALVCCRRQQMHGILRDLRLSVLLISPYLVGFSTENSAESAPDSP